MALPRHFQHFHLAETIGDLADTAKMIDVRVCEDDSLELGAVREFLHRGFEQIDVDGDALPRVEQKRALGSANEIGVGAWSGERAGILTEQGRDARRDARVVGHFQPNHRIGNDPPLLAHRTFLGESFTSRRVGSEKRRNLESRAEDARWVRTLTLILSLTGRGEDSAGRGEDFVILSAAKNPGSFSAPTTAPSTVERPL